MNCPALFYSRRTIMGENNEQVIEMLTRAASGLLYMSESDYPFEIIQLEGPTELTPDFIRSVSGEAEDSPVQEIEVEKFLSSGRYQGLLLVLRRQLSNLKAYKVGRINMPVYVVGRTREGSWLGVSTRVVET
jgi:hypothetical protein